MSYLNQSAREIGVKIVYYGCGMSGKTTNLQHIYARTNPQMKGKLLSLQNPENERTIFFDFLPLSLGEVGGFKTRFHLYSVPGQIFFDASRKIILEGTDAVVFVVDSRAGRLEANLESYDNLKSNLNLLGLRNLPVVLQYNKRDLQDVMPIAALEARFNGKGLAHLEACASSGVGVFETFKLVGKLALKSLRKREQV